MRIRLLFIAVLLLAACAPYKMDIRQGNLITSEQREQLKIGMTKAQVRVLLGTPLVSDPFHPERWDYEYRLEHQRKLVEQQRLTLYFTGENLVRIDDSRMPPLDAQPPAATEGIKP